MYYYDTDVYIYFFFFIFGLQIPQILFFKYKIDFIKKLNIISVNFIICGHCGQKGVVLSPIPGIELNLLYLLTLI
jgi:hypothetical protein